MLTRHPYLDVELRLWTGALTRVDCVMGPLAIELDEGHTLELAIELPEDWPEEACPELYAFAEDERGRPQPWGMAQAVHERGPRRRVYELFLHDARPVRLSWEIQLGERQARQLEPRARALVEAAARSSGPLELEWPQASLRAALGL